MNDIDQTSTDSPWKRLVADQRLRVDSRRPHMSAVQPGVRPPVDLPRLCPSSVLGSSGFDHQSQASSITAIEYLGSTGLYDGLLEPYIAEDIE